jgi:hypothetical protein
MQRYGCILDITNCLLRFELQIRQPAGCSCLYCLHMCASFRSITFSFLMWWFPAVLYYGFCEWSTFPTEIWTKKPTVYFCADDVCPVSTCIDYYLAMSIDRRLTSSARFYTAHRLVSTATHASIYVGRKWLMSCPPDTPSRFCHSPSAQRVSQFSTSQSRSRWSLTSGMFRFLIPSGTDEWHF